MDWTGDVVRAIKVTCPAGHKDEIWCKSSEFKDELARLPLPCSHGPDCEEEMVYAGWCNVPAAHGGLPERGMCRTSFEKNGRVGYKMGATHMSATKWNYMETGKVENVYTADFKNKVIDKQVETYKKDIASLSK